jgi:hypothetical protein
VQPRMKHHEIVQHIHGCAHCQKVSGKLSHTLEMMVEAHVAMKAASATRGTSPPRNEGATS